MTTKRDFTIVQAINDENIFGRWFKNRATWASWEAFLASLFALDLTPEQLAIYQRHTGRTDPPESPASEAWLVVGRRGGKSLIMALCAVYLGCFRNYRPYLAPGERATIAVIAADRKQARVVMRYIRAFLTHIPLLANMIQREAAELFELTNKVTIEVTTANQRATRGYSFAAVICDEIAWWRTDEYSANPDTEILDAIRPGMATIDNSLLICASSPYARRGAIAHREGDDVVLDALREATPPFSPEAVVGEFVQVARSYGARRVTGDRYGGEFPRELFRRRGLAYEVCDQTGATCI